MGSNCSKFTRKVTYFAIQEMITASKITFTQNFESHSEQ